MSQRIRQPLQERSQETMLRILDAFEKLLRKRSYESISINDIAKEASTGAGSIYARFDGKRSILLAVHARLRDRVRRYFRALFNPATSVDESVEAAIERVIRGMFAWHRRHQNIIKTSLILDDADVYNGISVSFAPYSGQMALLLKARMPSLSDEEVLKAAIAILQITIASLQQRAIFGDIAPIGHALSDEEIVAIILAASLGQLSAITGQRGAKTAGVEHCARAADQKQCRLSGKPAGRSR